MTIKSKERVKRAFHFDKPDRIPRVYNLYSNDNDFFPFSCLQPIEFQPQNYPPHLIGGNISYASKSYYKYVDQYRWRDEFRKNLKLPEDWWNYEQDNQVLTIDEWGIVWKNGALNRDLTMGHPYKGPFQDSWDELNHYIFPDARVASRYRYWNSITKKTSKGKYIVAIPNILFIHNLTSFLRGFNQIMIDFIKNPNKVYFLIEKVTDFFLTQIPLIKKICPQLNAIMFLDDLGSQKSPFLSPTMFRKFFFKPYKKVFDLVHDFNADVILHSCGQLKELLPIFSDLQIDALEFDSPMMTGVDNFKKYAQDKKIAFWLSPNIQTTFTFGTPEEIEEEVKLYVKEIGNNNGGLAFYTYLGYYVLNAPKQNYEAYLEIMKKWGNYNKDGKIDWLA